MTETFSSGFLKKLKAQKADGLLFLDTPKLIVEALESGITPEIILIEKGKTFDFLNKIKQTTSNKLEPIIVNKSIIETLSDTKTPQGILAGIKIESKKLTLPKGNFLVCDGLQDVGNIGTLIRTALGTNFMDIYLVASSKLNNIKLIRSSMGGVFKTRIYECSRNEFIEFASKNSLKIYGADMHGENVFKKPPPTPCGIAVGSEGNGLSNELKQICTDFISIPMSNNLESLNAAVSGSIIMLLMQHYK